MKPLSAMVEVFGWPLLHFLWQGTLIASVCAILFAVLRNAAPRIRYLIGCGALLLCLLWPAYGVLQQWQTPQAMSLEAALLMLHDASPAVDLVWVEQSAFAARLEAWLPLLVSFWLAGVMLMLVRLSLGILWVYRLGRSAQSGDAWQQMAAWQQRTMQMSQHFGIRRHVRLRIQEQLLSPVTIGCLRPLILIPASLLSGMSPQLIEALIAHELAHIKRWDYLANLLQNLVLSLLFYHPAVWWLSHRIDAERELIADDMAISVLGQGRELACALQQLDQLQANIVRLAPAAHGGDLLARIKRLIRPDAQPWHWKMAMPVVGIACALILVLGVQSQVVAGPEPLVADNATKPQAHVGAAAQHDAHVTAYVKTGAEHVMVLDEDSGQVLLSKNADREVPIASLSKLITAMVTLDAQLDMQERITISKADVAQVPPGMLRLQPGTVLTRQNLLELSLIPSHNMAAKALARTYPGGNQEFVRAVAQKLEQLGLKHTHIAEASGISLQNTSTASDLARFAKVAATYPELRRLTQTPSGTLDAAGSRVDYRNTNPWVTQKSWDISLSKTGFSRAAGRCMLMRFMVAGKPVIMVLLNAKDLALRDQDVMQIRAMLERPPQL
jgi:D-alanyl-D-alanine endopeptidase (penicillin-binding protein 7)